METKIICEIASSHNGDLDLAKALIVAAADNGADIVKFQDWRASNVSDNDPDKTRYEKYQFPDEWYPILRDYCKENHVEFLTSCFNKDRVKFLADLGLKKIKIASVCMTNTELLMMAGAHFEEVIVSTAMHTQEEIEEAIDLLATNCKKFTIMACTANYPLHWSNANLKRIDKLKEMLEGQEYASVGYSNHSLDLDVPRIAINKEIEYLEVHFSLSRYLPQTKHQMYENGPFITTHEVSLEPQELKLLDTYRIVYDNIKGDGTFTSNEIEQGIKKRYLGRYGQ